MDSATLVAALDFSRSRLLGLLATIEKTAAERGIPVQQILAWRPGPGRAHIGWQAIHCAATHDKYLNVAFLGKAAPNDPVLVANFGGGSTPSDENVPDLVTIRAALEKAYTPFRNAVSALDAAALARTIPGPNNTQRTVGEAIMLLTWHEAHHQGQIHLTWNLYKAAHGI
jgi:hypothetical protein